MTTQHTPTHTTPPTTTAPAPAPASSDRCPEHTPRLAWAKLAPDVYRAMVKFDQAARSGLDPVVAELVKIRASQLNHCAYCLDMHSKDALAAGETVERVVQLASWEEARHFYTPKEVAALRLTEAMTLLTEGFVPDEVYAEAAAHFEEPELARLIAAITAINSWNRLSVTTRMVPGHHRPGDRGSRT